MKKNKYAIIRNAEKIIKNKFSSNKGEPNKEEIKANKVKRNKWGFPIVVKGDAPKATKKIR